MGQEEKEDQAMVDIRKAIKQLTEELKRPLNELRYYALLLVVVGVVMVAFVASWSRTNPDGLDSLETISLLVVGFSIVVAGLKCHGARLRGIFEALQYHRQREEQLEKDRRKVLQEADKGKGPTENQRSASQWAGSPSNTPASPTTQVVQGQE